MKIEDGSGHGFNAKVDSEHRILTRSLNINMAQHHSQVHGTSFVVDLRETADSLTVTTTGGYILLLQNNSSKDVIISRIIGSTDGAIYVWMVRNPDIGTLANNTAITPTNMNFGSANPSGAVVNIWDEVGDGITGITGGTDITPLRIVGGTVVDLQYTGDTIIPRGSVLGIKAKGLAASRELMIFMTYYEFDSNINA